MSIIATDNLEVEDTTIVELEDKNGNELLGDGGKPRTITIYGPGSRPFVEAKAKAKARDTKRWRTQGGRVKADADADLDHEASFLADITISFDNWGLTDEQQTRQAFREFYANPKVGYITAKVNSAAGDWANF